MWLTAQQTLHRYGKWMTFVLGGGDWKLDHQRTKTFSPNGGRSFSSYYENQLNDSSKEAKRQNSYTVPLLYSPARKIRMLHANNGCWRALGTAAQYIQKVHSTKLCNACKRCKAAGFHTTTQQSKYCVSKPSSSPAHPFPYCISAALRARHAAFYSLMKQQAAGLN